MEIDTSADVIIVGAGASGLMAAKDLSRAGINCLILEARNRTGGRIYSQKVSENLTIELGAQWLARSGQDLLMALSDEGQVHRQKLFRHGLSLKYNVLKNECLATNLISLLPAGYKAKLDLIRLVFKINSFAKSISPERPWETYPALDQISLSDWLEENCWSKDTCAFLKNTFEQGLCRNLTEVSTLEAFSNLSSIGSLSVLNEAEEWCYPKGISSVLNQLEQALDGKIYLSHSVNKIEQTPSAILVHAERKIFSCRRVIVSVPPHITKKIQFEPQLANDYTLAADGFLPGLVVKGIFIFETPDWRRQGLSGQVYVEDGNVDLILDSGFSSDGPGVLVSLSTGSRASKLLELNPDARLDSILDVIRKSINPRSRLLSRHSHDWVHDEFSLGGYSSRRKLNHWNLYQDVLSRPQGHIFFCGTETAIRWRGYVEGALQSGVRAALEVQKSLTSPC